MQQATLTVKSFVTHGSLWVFVGNSGVVPPSCWKQNKPVELMGVLQSAQVVYVVLSGEAIWSWCQCSQWASAITPQPKHVSSPFGVIACQNIWFQPLIFQHLNLDSFQK